MDAVKWVRRDEELRAAIHAALESHENDEQIASEPARIGGNRPSTNIYLRKR